MMELRPSTMQRRASTRKPWIPSMMELRPSTMLSKSSGQCCFVWSCLNLICLRALQGGQLFRQTDECRRSKEINEGEPSPGETGGDRPWKILWNNDKSLHRLEPPSLFVWRGGGHHWEYRSAAVSDLATMGVSNVTISPDYNWHHFVFADPIIYE